jgi:hypothetical protein
MANYGKVMAPLKERFNWKRSKNVQGFLRHSIMRPLFFFSSSIYKMTKEDIVSAEQPGGNQEIYLYPNPVSDRFSVSCGLKMIKRLSVLDLKGQIFFDQEIAESNKFVVDLSQIPAGVYVVRVETNNKGNMIRRLVKKQSN